MFGLHLWARPFLHPSPTPGSTAPGVDPPHTVPRHPAAAFGAPGYLLPHLGGDKSGVGSGMPFNPSSLLLYRPGEHYLHPSLLRLNMDPSGLHLPHPGAAERALHPGLFHQGEDGESYPSAFQPTKRAKLEDQGSHGRPDSTKGSEGGRYSSTEAISPGARYAVTSSPGAAGGKHSPAADGRSSAGVRSPDSISGRRPDTGDHISDHERNSYGGSPGSELGEGQVRCPVCGMHLQAGEIGPHYAQEVDRLMHFFKENGDKIFGMNRSHVHHTSPGSHLSTGPSPTSSMSGSRYETYLKIRGNRHARLNAKFRVGRRKRASDTPPHSGSHPEHLQLTPPCNTPSKPDSHHLQQHEPDIDPVTCDGQESEIIVVDRDVPTSTATTAADALSHHSTSPHTSPVTTSAGGSSDPLPGAHHPNLADSPVATMAAMAITSASHTTIPGAGGSSPFMLMDHRFRLPAGDDMKCHVCNKTYDKPVTSVQCWHTHCEECWLQSLGSKRTCPRCNVVTSPSELRKVYI